jgi:CheY-like chemotaxis protein
MEPLSMKAKPATLGSRHPKVVMIFENEEDVLGAGRILSAQISEYRTIALNRDTARFLIKTKPSVILFALSNVEQSIESYSVLVEKGTLDYPHYSILLCNNKESYIAFRCCMKKLFDDYFVYQPLYEKFRLLMIVHNGLEASQSNSDITEFNEEVFEQIDEELALQIDEASCCKQNLLEKINRSKADIIKVTEELQQIPVLPELSAQQIMSKIDQEHIKPLLTTLENEIILSLDQILSQLVTQQITLKTKSLQSDGLIKNSPPNRKQSESFENIDISVVEQEDEISSSEKREQDKTINPIITAPEIKDVKRSKILVVEDNALYRDMLVSVLLKENLDVDTAQDGLEALQKIKEHHFDLIIMDLFMPNMDGLKATKKIHQISGGRDIPVVALTGNKNKELILKWASFGLKGYLIKPSTKEEILLVVYKVLGSTQKT